MSCVKKDISDSNMDTFIENYTEFLKSFNEIKFTNWEFDADQPQKKIGAQFKILDKFEMSIIRGKNNSHYFTCKVQYAENEIFSFESFTTYGDPAYIFPIDVATNPNVVYIQSYSSSRKSFNKDIIFAITDNNNYITGYSSTGTTNAIDQKLFDLAGSQRFIIPTRCNYTLSSNKNDIEVIMNKSVVEGSTQVDTISHLYDCSSIPKSGIYMFDNQRYYAINSNTLIPV